MLNCFSLLKIARNRFCKNAYFFPSASHRIIKELSIPLQKQNLRWVCWREHEVAVISERELWSKDEFQTTQAPRDHRALSDYLLQRQKECLECLIYWLWNAGGTFWVKFLMLCNVSEMCPERSEEMIISWTRRHKHLGRLRREVPKFKPY